MRYLSDWLWVLISIIPPAGTGFTVIPLNSGRYLVQSVPGEMSLDQVSVLDQAEKYRGLVTENILQENLQWDQQRSGLVLGKQIDQRDL